MGSNERAFAEKQRTTLCPFARKAKVAFGPSWHPSQSDDANWDAAARALEEWATTAKEAGSHGFVLELGASPATDFETVKTRFHAALQGLSLRDPRHSPCLTETIDAAGWQFEFAGIRMFLNVFGACYPEQHSKHFASDEHFYVFVQPEFSFDLCGINRSRRTTKHAIRSKFASAGQPYSGDLIDARVEARLYMFPIEVDGPYTRWWL